MTKSERKAVAETLRRAAEIVDGGRRGWDARINGACDAIWRVAEGAVICSYANEAFINIIGSTRGCGGIFWWPLNEAHRPVRVIALLLAADVVESGDWE